MMIIKMTIMVFNDHDMYVYKKFIIFGYFFEIKK